MKLNIAVLPGDGIGPEISVQGVEVMSAVCEKFGHEVHYEYALCGADAIDKVGDPFPEETYRICKDADAVLFSAVGDPKFDNDPTAKVRPEQGLLAMRKKLGLFANIRPVQTFKCLLHKSPLRAELVKRGDMMSSDDVVEILAVDLLGVVPDDENIVVSTNQGEPLVGNKSLAGQAYENICHRIMGEDVPLLDLYQKNGLFSKIKNKFKS